MAFEGNYGGHDGICKTKKTYNCLYYMPIRQANYKKKNSLQKLAGRFIRLSSGFAWWRDACTDKTLQAGLVEENVTCAIIIKFNISTMQHNIYWRLMCFGNKCCGLLMNSLDTISKCMFGEKESVTVKNKSGSFIPWAWFAATGAGNIAQVWIPPNTSKHPTYL